MFLFQVSIVRDIFGQFGITVSRTITRTKDTDNLGSRYSNKYFSIISVFFLGKTFSRHLALQLALSALSLSPPCTPCHLRSSSVAYKADSIAHLVGFPACRQRILKIRRELSCYTRTLHVRYDWSTFSAKLLSSFNRSRRISAGDPLDWACCLKIYWELGADTLKNINFRTVSWFYYGLYTIKKY